jgi:APA family basic amino acid/polyamine antiporter
VSAGVVGSFGAQPLIDPATGIPFKEGSPELYASAACQAAHAPTVCSKEALAHILREVSNPMFGNLVGLAAAIALPSVVLLMMYGQTRIFFVMARDGLLPERLSAVHDKFRTPYVVTIVTGIFVAIAAAFLPVGTLADYSNAGTLFAFAAVSLGVMILRKKDPNRPRPFRTPAIFIVAPLSIAGCILLFINLNNESKLLFASWTIIGLIFYFLYGYRHSHVARGVTEVPELAPEAPGSIGIAPMPRSPVPPQDIGDAD